MISVKITNHDLTALLVQLGFEQSEGTKALHRGWRHPQTGTTFILPVNKVDEEPLQANLLTVRKGLDRNGLLKSTDFDEFTKTGKLPKGLNVSS